MKNEKIVESCAAEKEPAETAGQAAPARAEKGEQPDLRVVQPEVQLDGTTKFKPVGGLWRSISKSGNEFYTMKIGKLKLLVFPNDKERFAQEKGSGQ